MEPATPPGDTQKEELPPKSKIDNSSNEDEVNAASETSQTTSQIFTPKFGYLPLKVIHASRTVRGAFHKNEDRHSIFEWDDWPVDVRVFNHLKNAFETTSPTEPPPIPESSSPVNNGGKQTVSIPTVPDLSEVGPLAGTTVTSPSEVPRPRAYSTDITQPRGGMYTGPTAAPAKMYPDSVSTERAFLWTCADGHDGPAAAEFVTSQIGPVLKSCWEYETMTRGMALEGRTRNNTESGSESPIFRNSAVETEVIVDEGEEEEGDAEEEDPIVGEEDEKEERDDTGYSREKSHPPTSEEMLLVETFELNEEEEFSPSVLEERLPATTEEADEIALRKLVSVFQRTYHEVERKYINAVKSKGKGALVSRLVNSGSCVASLFLVGNFLVCSSLGDCRALLLTLDHHSAPKSQTRCDLAPALSRGFESSEGSFHLKKSARFPPNNPYSDDGQGAFRFVWMNVAHRASLEEETRRIQKLGGTVSNGRVDGILEPSRTIGDLDVKWSQPPGVLSVVPDVRGFQVTAPSLILLATDGVWDVIKPRDVLHMIHKSQKLCNKLMTWLSQGTFEVPLTKSYASDLWRFVTRSGPESQDVTEPTSEELSSLCEQIIRKAKNKKSMDDITVSAIFLKPYTDSSASTAQAP